MTVPTNEAPDARPDCPTGQAIKAMIVCAVLCLTATLAWAAPQAPAAGDFYIDPEHGDDANDGSAKSPWRSLQKVLDAGLIRSREWESLPYKKGKSLVPKNTGGAVKAGDTIWLRTGYYGEVLIQSFYNRGYITIAAQEGHKPRFRKFHVRSSSHWKLKGLSVSPEFGTGKKRPRTLIDLDAHGWRGPVHDVVVDGCVLRSAADTSDWSAEDWNERSCNGIHADGTRMKIRNNRLLNVDFGISVTASHSLVEYNTVENFAGDGLRGLGDHTVFQYNVVKNCYDVNGNHDDGFQSWSHGPDGVGTGEVIGIVLRGNRIINYEDPHQPHRGSLQGIGCFDGMFVDWTVENNVIIVDHWHGITLLGARGCRIINNTVIDQNDRRPGPPWVRIGKKKDGKPSVGCIIRNNLARSISADRGQDVTVDHNVAFDDAGAVFVDASGGDLRPKKGSPAIDAGSKDAAPDIDIRKVSRPRGDAVDAGAYEFGVKE